MQEKFKVYKSSAGSGKTFTLVREFVAHVLLNPENFRRILAITFTNKAANEMKERIVGALVALSSEPELWSGSARLLVAPITNEHQLTDIQIKNLAAQAIRKILHNYTDFAVSTIDSFMQRVIRTFSTEINLPHNYEVELDTASLRLRAVDRLIDKVGIDEGLTDLLVDYTLNKVEDDKSWQVEHEIYKVAKSLFKDDGLEQREMLKDIHLEDFTSTFKNLRGWVRKYENQLAEIGDNSLNLIASRQLEISDFSYAEKGIAGYFLKLKTGKLQEAKKGNTYIHKAIHDDAWTKKNQLVHILEAINEIKPALIANYNEANRKLEDQFADYKLYKLLLEQLYATAVLANIERIIDEIKEEERILPISEFNRIVAGVTLSEPTPYIYEKIGVRFKHIMIDEFQDTSVLQWMNLLPLVENSLASNNFSLVVGDAKQAIYRWRNGDVEQFMNLPKLTRHFSKIDSEREQTLSRHYRSATLAMNFRSHKTIVEFNNALFSFLANRLPQNLAGIYGDIVQEYRSDKQDGYVQIDFIHKNTEEGYDERQCSILLSNLKSAVEDGYNLGDIAVLCRENKNCSLIARYLLENGIKVISSDSLLLGSSNKVNLVMACMRLLVNPSDQMAYAECINYLVQLNLIPTESLHECFVGLFGEKTDKWQNNFFDPEKFHKYLNARGIALDRCLLPTTSLYDMAEDLIRIFGFQKNEDIYLQFFCEELHQNALKNKLQADNLKSWWNEKGAEISVVFPENIDAVQVMSIHKAKGLQFPVVIYAFASSKVSMKDSYGWFDLDDPIVGNIRTAYLPYARLEDTALEKYKVSESEKSLLDLINIMYVACTRPEDRLYILTKVEDADDNKENSVHIFLREFVGSQVRDFIFRDGATYSIGKRSCITPVKNDLKPEDVVINGQEQTSNRLMEMAPKQMTILRNKVPESWLNNELCDARAFGSVAHYVLSKISSFEKANQVLDELLISGAIAPEFGGPLQNMLGNLAKIPAILEVFKPGGTILTEPEILLTDGKVYRPDRIVMHDDACWIYEFKTGARHNTHEEQLKGYMQLLHQMNYKNIRGMLIYLDDTCSTVEISL